MNKIKVFYNDKQVHDAGSFSKSPLKPGLLARRIGLDPAFSIEQSFAPATRDHLKMVHDHGYVDDVLAGAVANGFGNRSIKDAAAICYTVGNLLEAVDYAYTHDTVAWSLTSGFHHACHDSAGGFCTFDGLTLAAEILYRNADVRTLIIDEDAHYGNGCEDIINRLDMHSYCRYVQSAHTHRTNDLMSYARHLRRVIEEFEPSMILYQAGADNWVCDPLGGSLTMQELFERDRITLNIAKDFNIPIVVTLAGGYAHDYDDTLAIHMNTGEAMKAVYQGVEVTALFPVHAMELEHA
jgi:acetoin utilization deacetylase AcuC-like enzyme